MRDVSKRAEMGARMGHDPKGKEAPRTLADERVSTFFRLETHVIAKWAKHRFTGF